MKEIKVNKDAVIKVVGYACTIAGMLLGAVSSNRENAKNIEKAVKDFHEKK